MVGLAFKSLKVCVSTCPAWDQRPIVTLAQADWLRAVAFRKENSRMESLESIGCGVRCTSAERSDRVPRSEWGPGPWQDEPDRVDFEHAGLPCLAHRGPSGQWCGYVGLPPTHPAYGQHYDQVDVDAHGGLTYSDRCHGHICHV